MISIIPFLFNFFIFFFLECLYLDEDFNQTDIKIFKKETEEKSDIHVESSY